MTRGISLSAGGRAFATWTRCEITRDLHEISGSFIFDYEDTVRAADTLPAMAGQVSDLAMSLHPGMKVEIAIDDEPVLTGWADDVRLNLDGERFTCSISGRDTSGDLVDCSAHPTGPAEYRSIDLTEFTTALAAPFGVSVTADVDVGPEFNTLALDAAEAPMAAIEKAARQRAVLVVSDGIGGLVLTRAGTRRGPAPLILPGNVHGLQFIDSWRNRFSDYWVKGQVRNASRPAPHLDSTVVPFDGSPPPPPPPAQRASSERSAIVMTGHAIDPEITRYRPRVWLARTQSGGGADVQNATPDPELDDEEGDDTPVIHGRNVEQARRRSPKAPRSDPSPWTLQDQAEWRRRTSTARAAERGYVVIGWRAGDDRRLWRPNELVLVTDPFTQLDEDRLVSGVTYLWGEDGARARLKVVHPDAFDLTGDAETGHYGRRRAHHTHATDATARRYR